jgi:hypothetical protein
MAVLVQPLLNAALAGAAFSCNPLNLSRTELTIAWTRGVADRLVGGQEPGEMLRVSPAGEVIDGQWPGPRETLSKLVDGVKALEADTSYPVDAEWLVDDGGDLWFVQSRPVALPKSGRISLRTTEDVDSLPPLVGQHHKIRLRRRAIEAGILMAPAVVESISGHTDGESEMAQIELGESAGVSVVLLHPERVNEKIVREFSPAKGSNVEFFTSGCRRYAIRRYPTSKGLVAAAHSVLLSGLKENWMSVAIVQAVWDAVVTGIIRRFRDGYIVELAQGHFVPKGIVRTSTIVLSNDKEVVSADWKRQPVAYRFIDGYVVTETPPLEQVKLTDEDLVSIADAMDPLLELYGDAALEFGVVKRSGRLVPYLIDVAEGDIAGIQLDAALINSGVLSVGVCQGHASPVRLKRHGALDRHLHDKTRATFDKGRPVVVVAEQPSVELLPLVGAPGVVGFAFRQGSVLAHLAVVLREKGIPAIIVDDRKMFQSLSNGVPIRIDAATRSLAREDRITLME